MYEKRLDGKYYFVIKWVQGINALFYDNSGRWYAEDRVARDIVYAYTREYETIKINGGIPLYYGIGVGDQPEQFSILGHEPDGIIPFEYRGEVFFFWYYRSDHQFGKIFEQNIDIQLFALGEIIDLFEIKID